MMSDGAMIGSTVLGDRPADITEKACDTSVTYFIVAVADTELVVTVYARHCYYRFRSVTRTTSDNFS